MSIFEQPSRELLDGFVAGDPVAIDEVITLILPQISRWATSQFPTLPEQEVESAVNQVLAEICNHHDRYDPDRSQITTYAIGLIKLRLSDVGEKQSGINTSEINYLESYENVSSQPYKESEDIVGRIATDEFFLLASERLTETEREFLELIRQGEKRLEVFVKVLEKYGVCKDPDRDVKNTKERLLRKLRAIAQESGFEADDLIG